MKNFIYFLEENIFWITRVVLAHCLSQILMNFVNISLVTEGKIFIFSKNIFYDKKN